LKKGGYLAAGKSNDYTGGIGFGGKMNTSRLLNHPVAGRYNPDFTFLNTLLCRQPEFYAL
jgi:hypothetical protein